MKLTDKITFGKHKGETLEEVILSNPTYIEWALDEIDSFEIDDEAMGKYQTSIDDHYDDRIEHVGRYP